MSVRVDAILITTVEADTIEDAEDFIRNFADGLADEHNAPFTGLVHTSDTDNDGQRVFYLHGLDEQSQCGGAEDGWHLTPNNEPEGGWCQGCGVGGHTDEDPHVRRVRGRKTVTEWTGSHDRR